jgi:hypothetical protein
MPRLPCPDRFDLNNRPSRTYSNRRACRRRRTSQTRSAYRCLGRDTRPRRPSCRFCKSAAVGRNRRTADTTTRRTTPRSDPPEFPSSGRSASGRSIRSCPPDAWQTTNRRTAA